MDSSTNISSHLWNHRVHEPSKVRVQNVDSLYLISYCDRLTPIMGNYNVYLYIDIPTIDYYNDELKDNRLYRINKKFKLHRLREKILKSIVGENDELWTLSKQLAGDFDFHLEISSSGSLRYVETVKFLIETVWQQLKETLGDRCHINYKIKVTPTSLKWFTTFLSKDMLRSCVIHFDQIDNYNMISESTTPFKDYYRRLNDKFTHKVSPMNCDCIIVVTNNTGVKALLTILSDKPLTAYLSEESLETLNNTSLKNKRPLASPNNVTPTDSEDETPLTRNSSSILSFQNTILTSNKDKSVRVRSLSINRSSNRATKFQSSEAGGIFSESDKATDYEDEVDDEGDDDDYDDDEDEDDDEDDDGLSFYAPSKLSSYTSDNEAQLQDAARIGGGRVRSISLIDSTLEAPFSNTKRNEPLSLEKMEDEMCSPTENSLQSGRYTNIYVHDGQFNEDGANNLTSQQKKKIGNSSSSGNISQGLIPPVFYSRLSSPSTSNNSSSSSLNNLSLLPGTFSKLLAPKVEPQGQSSADNTGASLFGKDLINKSFEEVRRKPTLLKYDPISDKFGLALSFNPNRKIPALEADEEDMLMSGPPASQEDETVTGVSDAESSNTLLSSRNQILKDLGSVSQDKIYTHPLDKSSSEFQKREHGSKEPSNTKENKSTPYTKPKFTLDLYGDDDINNSGGWLLGGNAR